MIKVYIGYLRKKIDAPFGLQTLVTLRGLGYRLDTATCLHPGGAAPMSRLVDLLTHRHPIARAALPPSTTTPATRN